MKMNILCVVYRNLEAKTKFKNNFYSNNNLTL